ncbi:hypothetical protein [Methanonatronarchaeum sp. AMET-Sl]|uniref:arsenate-mycothiol transferase ArsC n=1 Tax=Methanonatronarchaeum sp. AMET-Sl TaxID=3037654 RepID=UPI00244E2F69|nr:hypothetical protein [Methanonatronarchaeum sp. AMET-Sl]WGI18026.1 hypothetical protein QEN48_03210 [Methanonatronarchaeum sp. AMET-Sl]
MSELSIAFVCVENAGRSQMAAGFANKIVLEKELDIEVVSGGTAPTGSIHNVVIDVMDEVGIDISDEEPRRIKYYELRSIDYIVTMGCSQNICPSNFDVKTIDWDLKDPKGKEIDEVRIIRDEIKEKVSLLLNDLA